MSETPQYPPPVATTPELEAQIAADNHHDTDAAEEVQD